MCISERCECVNGLSDELARTILESNAKRTRERRDPQLHSTAGSGRGELQCKLVLALQLPGAIAAAKQKAPLTEELSAAMGWEVNNLTPVIDGASEDAAGSKSSIDEFHTGSEDNHVALEVPDGEAVDANAKASISCARQQTARPKALPHQIFLQRSRVWNRRMPMRHRRCQAAEPSMRARRQASAA